MKYKLRHLFLLFIFSLLVFSVNAKAITCTLKGKVIGRDSKNIFLHKGTSNVRYGYEVIPIVNNAFEYTFEVPEVEAYVLVFEDEYNKNGWRPIVFFSEQGEVHFELFPMMEGDKNKIVGGKLNQVHQDYLTAQQAFNTQEIDPLVKPITEKLKELWKIGKGESEQANALREEWKIITKKSYKMFFDYIDKNPSLVSYYFFTDDLLMNQKYTNDDITHRASVFSKLYPDHPYTTLVREKLISLESIQPGGKYIDFSAPDLEGNIAKISDLLKNQEFLLVDFWASWCGPCIRASRTMIPVYQEFKDKGFSVIGIAREKKNADAMKRVVAGEKYPWKNLIELNDQNGIWDKYNISYNTGALVLIHKSGEVVAVDPNADELRKILQARLMK